MLYTLHARPVQRKRYQTGRGDSLARELRRSSRVVPTLTVLLFAALIAAGVPEGALSEDPTASPAVAEFRHYVDELPSKDLRPTRRRALLSLLDAIDAHLAVPDACAASDDLLAALQAIAGWEVETRQPIEAPEERRNEIKPQDRRLALLGDLRERLLRLRVLILAESPAGRGCGGGATVGVDPTIVPVVESIAPFEAGGAPRPLAALRNARGVQTNFVANELWLLSEDQARADATAARVGGQIVLTVIGDDGSVHSLIRVRAPRGNPQALPALLARLRPGITDAISVSSEEGRMLLAMAAEEAAAGLGMGFNVVGLPAGIREGMTRDATDGPAGWNAGPFWSRNAFDWFHLTESATQAIGVPQAWQLLENLGYLRPLSVGLGVVDGGFLQNDLHPDSVFRSTVAGVDALGGANPFSPWHGVKVMQAAAGLVDNFQGAAGVAGPVVRPINVFAGGDFFAGAMVGTRTALDNGARIVNVSTTVDVPSVVDWLVLPFRAFTGELRNTVFTACAGNGGPGDDMSAPPGTGNVDALECFLGSCWESTFHTPCENPGVICVGGLAHNSLAVDRQSNFGTAHTDSMLFNDSVDIYAPFCVLVDGPDTPEAAEFACGTSFAAPYVAGVAALMLAAEPSLRWTDVARILRDTARTDSPDPVVHRIVDAQAAVRQALLPALNIIEPENGTAAPAGVEVRFEAFRYPESATAEVVWTSDRDGELGTGLMITSAALSPGHHVITASDGSLSDTVEILVTTIGIVSPEDGELFLAGETDPEGRRFVEVELVGAAFDPEDGQLTGGNLVWTDRVNGAPARTIATGSPATVALYLEDPNFTTHEITLTATDSDGNTQSFTVTVSVEEFI